MLWIARILRPGIEYHATHRGDQRRAVFIGDRGRKPKHAEEDQNQLELF
ncbi:MAG: hypothetical protein ABFD69_03680 [Candidatus Sumerlaeia bacterium]